MDFHMLHKMSSFFLIFLLMLASALPAQAQPAGSSPEPVSPPTGTLDFNAGISPLIWYPASGAASYGIELSDKTDFSTIIKADSNIGGTLYYLPTLQENTWYYWRVRAFDALGIPGGWSPWYSFRTGFNQDIITVKVITDDPTIRIVSLSSSREWSDNAYNQPYAYLDNQGMAYFRASDFPALFGNGALGFRRIDLLGADGRTLMGHAEVFHTYTQPVSPSMYRRDYILLVHRDIKNNRNSYPGWKWYANDLEYPITAVLPPGGRIAAIDSMAKAAVFMSGIGGAALQGWQDIQYNNTGRQNWTLFYPWDSAADTAGILAGRSIEYIASLYTGKKVAAIAHGTGGLALRAYIQSTGYSQSIDKVFLAGVPNAGSAWYARAWTTDDFANLSDPFLSDFGGRGPMLRDAIPGSDFLLRSNAQPLPALYRSADKNTSWFTLCGTLAMPLQPITHKEFPTLDDGLISVQHALLADLPGATIRMNHKDLLKNSLPVLQWFLRPEYSPLQRDAQIGQLLEGIWLSRDTQLSQDYRLTGSSPAIMLNTDAISGDKAYLNRTAGGLLLSAYPIADTTYLLPALTNGIFTSYTPANGWNMPFPAATYNLRLGEQIQMLIRQDSVTTRIPRLIPVSIQQGESIAVYKGRPWQQKIQAKDILAQRWLARSDSRIDMQYLPDATGITDFVIDQYMDTALIILATHNTAPAQGFSASFRLLSPAGDTLWPDGRSTAFFPPFAQLSFSSFDKEGIGYYALARPAAGRWKVLYGVTAGNENKNKEKTTLIVSALSPVSLRIQTADSLYKPGDTIAFSIILPDYFYTGMQLKAVLRTLGEGHPFIIKADTIALRGPFVQDNQQIYSGKIRAGANGFYELQALFTALFPTGPLQRSAITQIRVMDALPDIPTLITPVPLAVNNLPWQTRFVWNRAERGQFYHLQIDLDGTFRAPIADIRRMSDTNYTALLQPSTTYYWRIRSQNQRGFSQWTSPIRFSTGIYALYAPQTISPAPNSVQTGPLTYFTWQPTGKVMDSIYYRVQIGRDAALNSILYDSVIYSAAGTPGLILPGGIPLFWRIKSLRKTGYTFDPPLESDWSMPVPFRRFPGRAQPLSPADGSPDEKIVVAFRWTRIAPDVEYELQISTRPDFSTLLAERLRLPDTQDVLLLTSYATTHYWRVRWSLPDISTKGEWSDTYSFTTTLSAPYQDSPPNGSQGVNISPTLSWDYVPGARRFHLQVATDKAFSNIVFQDSTLGIITLRLQELQPVKQYFWRVRALNGQISSAWSQIWTFETGGRISSIGESGKDNKHAVISPQPAIPGATIQISVPQGLIQDQTYTVLLLDLQGRNMFTSQSTAAQSSLSITIPDFLAPGFYMISVQGMGSIPLLLTGK
jgi:hypothetical protein